MSLDSDQVPTYEDMLVFVEMECTLRGSMQIRDSRMPEDACFYE